MIPRRLLTSSVFFLTNVLTPQMALGEEAPKFEEQDTASAVATELPTETKAETVAEARDALNGMFISDGNVVAIERLGISIAPPAGWEVVTDNGTLSLIIREPKQIQPDYEKPKYQRNITVAAMHSASPIDEIRATQLKEELVKKFSEDSLVSDFQVTEHKFFNYRGTNDGLIVFSNLNIGEYPMTQMHVLVSGQEKQFLLTYTDMTERFHTNTENNAYEMAWNSIVSMEVTGETPDRMQEYYRYAAFGGGILLLGLVLFVLNRKAKNYDFASEADSMMHEGDFDNSPSLMATLAGQWKIGGDEDGEGAGLEFSNHGLAPRTRKSELVSGVSSF